MGEFTPTDEQTTIIEYDGAAFITACPGAGKTRCIVERARTLLAKPGKRQGLAFLSFTNAAVSELQERLARGQLLPAPVFPHFVGTFDSFVWHYMVQPFGMDVTSAPLQIVPDKGEIIVTPFQGAQGLRLDVFDRETGAIIWKKAVDVGFKQNRNPSPYEAAARSLRARLLENGQLDFDDIRRTASNNLENAAFSERLARVLRARFVEVIVDEAQDCNPADLAIVDWLRRQAQIPTKIVCDPHQSIYGFRGGISEELFQYSETFGKGERLSLSGNFRSSTHICKAVHMLRAPSQRGDQDQALGEEKDCGIKVHVLSYSGQGVSPQIGRAFARIAEVHGIELKQCRLTAKTRSSGRKAIGAYSEKVGNALSLRLAGAAMAFHHGENEKDQYRAIIEAHTVLLDISGDLRERTYHQAIIQDDINPMSWRGIVVKILRSLKFDPELGHTRAEWVARARAAFLPFLASTGSTIGQKLSNNSKLDAILGAKPASGLIPRTIHEVKGKEYTGMCVVLTTANAKAVLTHLEKEPDKSKAEDAREIYVAASRAQTLLVFACPKSQANRLKKHIVSGGADVELIEI